jgi:diacylglycerol kinase family enzyme
MKRAILVHNPTAGDGKHSVEALAALLREKGYRVSHVHATKKKQLKTLRDARGLIVVAGGDGTVHNVAKQVVGRGKTVALLPLGTANNIARSLGVEGSPREIVAGLSRARSIAIDVGIAKGPWGKRVFLEGAGGGLFAEVMAALDTGRTGNGRRRTNGDEKEVTRFSRHAGSLEPALRALADALPEFKAKAFEVSADGNRIGGDFLLLEAMNMPYLGPNLHLGPDADPGDGLLDFVLLGEAQRKEFEGYLRHRLDGGCDAPILTVLKGKRLRFAWRGARLHIDDKIVPIEKVHGNGPAEIEIEVKPKAMEFLIPCPK